MSVMCAGRYYIEDSPKTVCVIDTQASLGLIFIKGESRQVHIGRALESFPGLKVGEAETIINHLEHYGYWPR